MLCTHLALTTKREASHPFVLVVGEYWFNRAHASAVDFATKWRVKLLPHAFRRALAYLALLGRWTFLMFDESAARRQSGGAPVLTPASSHFSPFAPSLHIGWRQMCFWKVFRRWLRS